MFSLTVRALGRGVSLSSNVRRGDLAPGFLRTSLSATRSLSRSTPLRRGPIPTPSPLSVRSSPVRPHSLQSVTSAPSRVIIPRAFPRPSLTLQQPRRHYIDDPRLRHARPFISNDSLRRARSGTTWTVVSLAVAAAFVFYFSHLETVPVSGRTRFKYYSRDYVKSVADQQYQLLLKEFAQKGQRLLPDWDPRAQMVRRVMCKLIPFSGLTDENWEVFVVDDPHNANAAVLPNGKVFVFTGLLPVARSDSGLATVLGHEIAHVLADHTGEQMSQSIGTNLLYWSLMFLLAPFGGGPLLVSTLGAWVFNVAFDAPMSRLQESEADYVGLMMMAEACYDPREAVGFWHRMEQLHQRAPPEWLSTHPSDGNRARKIQEWLPQAMEKRTQSDCTTTTAFAEMFRRAMDRGVVMSEPF